MSSSPSLFCCRTASSSSKSKSSFLIKASKCSVQAVFRSRSRSTTHTTRRSQNRNQAVCSSSSNSNNTHTRTRMQNTRNTRSRNAPRGEEFLGGGFLSHLEEEFASIDRELLNARKRMTMFEEEGGGRGNDAREDLGPSLPSNRTVEKKREIRKERRGENSYSNFHYVESVTTYGGPPPGLSGARTGSVMQNGYALVGFAFVLCGTTFAYFKEKKMFARNFSLTNFKEEEKEKLALRWPILYLFSETFRREFRKTRVSKKEEDLEK